MEGKRSEKGILFHENRLRRTKGCVLGNAKRGSGPRTSPICDFAIPIGAVATLSQICRFGGRDVLLRSFPRDSTQPQPPNTTNRDEFPVGPGIWRPPRTGKRVYRTYSTLSIRHHGTVTRPFRFELDRNSSYSLFRVIIESK